jgi:SAM-dependent methyltransferase
MSLPTIPEPLPLDLDIEEETRSILIDHYSESYRDRVNDYVQSLLTTEHHTGRFQYLQSVVGLDAFTPETSVLISGFSVGSEMIVARQYGFGKVYGVEVDQVLVSACKSRLRYFDDMFPEYYEGEYLPYDAEQFTFVASSHVVEHTRDPNLYIQECMRVLAPGGYLLLEFPTRYHCKELHTGLPSFEWLPSSLRNVALRILSSKISPLGQEAKSRYDSILSTNLQQISLGYIKRTLKHSGAPFAILDSVKAAPGIIRSIIKKL